MTTVNRNNDNKLHGRVLTLTKDEKYDDMLSENLKKYPSSTCTRCKKEFAQLTSKQFKRCNHCRELQRLRTKRWQEETRQKDGVCSRCRTILTDSSFSLCPKCREYLRNNKETRLINGKCVHCSAPNDESDVYKVCKKCRSKDKARRLTLEHENLFIKGTSCVSQNQETEKACFIYKLKKASKHELSTTGSEEDMYGIDTSSKNFGNNNTSIQSNKFKRGGELLDRSLKQKQQRLDNDCGKIDFSGENMNVDISAYDEQSLEDNILETLTLHHDHAQLNQQLKRLSQYTSGGNDSMDVDVSKYSDEQSVLVDLHGLDDIDINYGLENVNGTDPDTNNKRVANGENLNEDEGIEEKCEEGAHSDDERDHDVSDYNNYENNSCNVGSKNGYSNDTETVPDLQHNCQKNESGGNVFNLQSDSIRNNTAKETMLLHVQALQEGVLSDDSEPSESEIAAAVEAVAAAAAAVSVVESNSLKG